MATNFRQPIAMTPGSIAQGTADAYNRMQPSFYGGAQPSATNMSPNPGSAYGGVASANATTQMVGEEGGGSYGYGPGGPSPNDTYNGGNYDSYLNVGNYGATTQMVGEEGGGSPATTPAQTPGAGGNYDATTQMVGEEGGGYTPNVDPNGLSPMDPGYQSVHPQGMSREGYPGSTSPFQLYNPYGSGGASPADTETDTEASTTYAIGEEGGSAGGSAGDGGGAYGTTQAVGEEGGGVETPAAVGATPSGGYDSWLTGSQQSSQPTDNNYATQQNRSDPYTPGAQLADPGAPEGFQQPSSLSGRSQQDISGMIRGTGGGDNFVEFGANNMANSPLQQRMYDQNMSPRQPGSGYFGNGYSPSAAAASTPTPSPLRSSGPSGPVADQAVGIDNQGRPSLGTGGPANAENTDSMISGDPAYNFGTQHANTDNGGARGDITAPYGSHLTPEAGANEIRAGSGKLTGPGSNMDLGNGAFLNQAGGAANTGSTLSGGNMTAAGAATAGMGTGSTLSGGTSRTPQVGEQPGTSNIDPIDGTVITDPVTGVGSVYNLNQGGSNWGGQDNQNAYNSQMAAAFGQLMGYGTPDSARNFSGTIDADDPTSGSANAGNSIGSLLANAYQQAFDANKEREGEIRGRYEGMEAELLPWLRDQIQGLNQGYGDRVNTGMGMLEGYGDQTLKDIEGRGAQASASAASNATGRGLGNTTIRQSMLNGVDRTTNDSLAAARDMIARTQFGAYQGLTGDQLGAQTNMMGMEYGANREVPQAYTDFIERITDSYPDMAKYLQLGLEAGKGVGGNQFPPIYNNVFGGSMPGGGTPIQGPQGPPGEPGAGGDPPPPDDDTPPVSGGDTTTTGGDTTTTGDTNNSYYDNSYYNDTNSPVTTITDTGGNQSYQFPDGRTIPIRDATVTIGTDNRSYVLDPTDPNRRYPIQDGQTQPDTGTSPGYPNTDDGGIPSWLRQLGMTQDEWDALTPDQKYAMRNGSGETPDDGDYVPTDDDAQPVAITETWNPVIGEYENVIDPNNPPFVDTPDNPYNIPNFTDGDPRNDPGNPDYTYPDTGELLPGAGVEAPQNPIQYPGNGTGVTPSTAPPQPAGPSPNDIAPRSDYRKNRNRIAALPRDEVIAGRESYIEAHRGQALPDDTTLYDWIMQQRNLLAQRPQQG